MHTHKRANSLVEDTQQPYPNKRTSPESSPSPSSSASSTPEPPSYVYIVKQALTTTDSHAFIVGIYTSLEDANNKAYGMRLDHETCHPCFFYVGEEVDGGCLSWEVPGDEDEGRGGEVGVRVFVERMVAVGNGGGFGGLGKGSEVVGVVGGVGGKRDWRRDLEPFTALNEPHWKPFRHR